MNDIEGSCDERGQSLVLPSIALSAILALSLNARVAAGEPDSGETAGPPRFSIHLLGFDDPLHTYPGGTRPTSINSDPGYGISQGGVAGTSSRFTRDAAGEDAWLFTREDPQLQQLGLLGPEYYISAPRLAIHRSRVSRVNDAGQVIGYTSTDPTSSAGRDHGWFFDPATGHTTRIGYSTVAGASSQVEDRPRYLLESGLAVGTSDTSTSGAPHWAWIYDPTVGSTQSIGLPNSVDVGPDGRPISQTVEAVTASGLVIGTSERNQTPSGSFHGTAVWVHRPGAAESERIGLFDGGYTRSDLQKISYFDESNSNGLVVGRSEFAAEMNGNSIGAWIYDSSTAVTTAIGLADPVDGQAYRDGNVLLTESNHAVGSSTMGESQLNWVFDHATGTTTVVGLRDASHVLEDGTTRSTVKDYSETGFVLGDSTRRDGPSRLTGRTTAWIYSPVTGTVAAAGLQAPRGQPPELSSGLAINTSGQAVGISYPQLHVDVKPWFFDPITEQTVPVADEFIRTLDARRSSPSFLNEHGQVVGITRTYAGDDEVWLFDYETGQTHAAFDYRDEFTEKEITIHALTDTGLVLGSNERRANGDHTPWLYDSNTGETHSLIFSQSSQGRALSQIAYLSDDGVILGEYDAYSESDESSKRYFYWSIAHGFHDLESLVDGDLDLLGWSSLAISPNGVTSGVANPRDIVAIDDSFLWARGKRLDGYEMAFALIQVPEPRSWALAASALLSLLGARSAAPKRKRPRLAF
ncbi:MAG: hypothetical protein CMJ58_03500 [Planctomycetaceae bacterium]|nr:hypothetical protein [Planctomycetaceae bacterium]